MLTSPQDSLETKELEELIISIKKGNIERYAFIVRVFQTPIYRYYYRLLENKQDADKKSSLYQEALQDLTAQANKVKRNGNLFMKAIPWSESGWISATYSKDNAYIGISASIMHGGKCSWSKNLRIKRIR